MCHYSLKISECTSKQFNIYTNTKLNKTRHKNKCSWNGINYSTQWLHALQGFASTLCIYCTSLTSLLGYTHTEPPGLQTLYSMELCTSFVLLFQMHSTRSPCWQEALPCAQPRFKSWIITYYGIMPQYHISDSLASHCIDSQISQHTTWHVSQKLLFNTFELNFIEQPCRTCTFPDQSYPL